MEKEILAASLLLLLVPSLVVAEDVAVWQGQYYIGAEFQRNGEFDFEFTVYDSAVGGSVCYSNTTILSTGHWGQWRTEQQGVSAACNDATKEYFLEIEIDGSLQTPRRRLTMFEYLRKDVNEHTLGNITFGDGSTKIGGDGILTTVIQANITNANISSSQFCNDMDCFHIEDFITHVNATYEQKADYLYNSSSFVGTGNFTGGHGFFSFLGGLIDRITKIFVNDIDISGNISLNGTRTVTNSTAYRVCERMQGMACVDWCTIQINNGLIVGCA